MTSSEKYNFKWNSFSDHVLCLMRDMLLSPNYADVTLVSDDGKLIRAHRTILQACSSVFNDILRVSTQSIHPVIYLRGITHSELEPLMELIYTGSATFERERLKEFLLVAKNLQIKDFCSIDEENDIENVNSETAETDTSIGEDNSDILQRNTPTNDDRTDITHSMTDLDKGKDMQYIQSSEYIEVASDEKSEKERDEANQVNNSIVNSPENAPIEESSEQSIQISENQNEKNMNDMQLLIPAIKTEDIPNSVNSAKNIPIKESCEQLKQISEISNEKNMNDMQLLVQAIKTEDIPISSGELRKKRKWKKIKKIKTMLRQQQKKFIEKTCPHCDFKSNSPDVASLVEHIMSKHEGVRWECEYCGYEATQPSNLKRHIKYKHKGLRYECSNCEKQLTTRSSLLRHMKSKYCGGIN